MTTEFWIFLGGLAVIAGAALVSKHRFTRETDRLKQRKEAFQKRLK